MLVVYVLDFVCVKVLIVVCIVFLMNIMRFIVFSSSIFFFSLQMFLCKSHKIEMNQGFFLISKWTRFCFLGY
jgi:hypothetical protein